MAPHTGSPLYTPGDNRSPRRTALQTIETPPLKLFPIRTDSSTPNQEADHLTPSRSSTARSYFDYLPLRNPTNDLVSFQLQHEALTSAATALAAVTAATNLARATFSPPPIGCPEDSDIEQDLPLETLLHQQLTPHAPPPLRPPPNATLGFSSPLIGVPVGEDIEQDDDLERLLHQQLTQSAKKRVEKVRLIIDGKKMSEHQKTGGKQREKARPAGPREVHKMIPLTTPTRGGTRALPAFTEAETASPPHTPEHKPECSTPEPPKTTPPHLISTAFPDPHETPTRKPKTPAGTSLANSPVKKLTPRFPRQLPRGKSLSPSLLETPTRGEQIFGSPTKRSHTTGSVAGGSPTKFAGRDIRLVPQSPKRTHSPASPARHTVLVPVSPAKRRSLSPTKFAGRDIRLVPASPKRTRRSSSPTPHPKTSTASLLRLQSEEEKSFTTPDGRSAPYSTVSDDDEVFSHFLSSDSESELGEPNESGELVLGPELAPIAEESREDVVVPVSKGGLADRLDAGEKLDVKVEEWESENWRVLERTLGDIEEVEEEEEDGPVEGEFLARYGGEVGAGRKVTVSEEYELVDVVGQLEVTAEVSRRITVSSEEYEPVEVVGLSAARSEPVRKITASSEEYEPAEVVGQAASFSKASRKITVSSEEFQTVEGVHQDASTAEAVRKITVSSEEYEPLSPHAHEEYFEKTYGRVPEGQTLAASCPRVQAAAPQHSRSVESQEYLPHDVAPEPDKPLPKTIDPRPRPSPSPEPINHEDLPHQASDLPDASDFSEAFNEADLDDYEPSTSLLPGPTGGKSALSVAQMMSNISEMRTNGAMLDQAVMGTFNSARAMLEDMIERAQKSRESSVAGDDDDDYDGSYSDDGDHDSQDEDDSEDDEPEEASKPQGKLPPKGPARPPARKATIKAPIAPVVGTRPRRSVKGPLSTPQVLTPQPENSPVYTLGRAENAIASLIRAPLPPGYHDLDSPSIRGAGEVVVGTNKAVAGKVPRFENNNSNSNNNDNDEDEDEATSPEKKQQEKKKQGSHLHHRGTKQDPYRYITKTFSDGGFHRTDRSKNSRGLLDQRDRLLGDVQELLREGGFGQAEARQVRFSAENGKRHPKYDIIFRFKYASTAKGWWKVDDLVSRFRRDWTRSGERGGKEGVELLKRLREDVGRVVDWVRELK
ncbi:hypothetical protein BJ508DRAFT_329506 [Ascobolus immersus RN42]|uniref:Uncharacterized protein n=1 Tax=Ascobolus immersus RN42 TaxID=1160509 RepID=A0A3N4I1L9_ASCIM|nr:hypothetical protein BJ508DRAFT_329506 [Ascobolus immersus RN42]